MGMVICSTGFYESGAAGTDLGCTACTAVADKASAATLTCKSATTSQLVGDCAATHYKVTSGDADVCTACTVVTGALSAATYTCTSATDSRVPACAAADTTKQTVGAAAAGAVAGTMDTCTAACADGSFDNSDVCTACTKAAGDATVTCTAAGLAVVVTCANGYYNDAADPAVCTACLAVD